MTDVRTTQVFSEEWITTNPDARTTQVALEMWATVQNVTQQAVVTQIVLEQWASVDLPVVPSQAVRVQVLA